MWSKGYFWTSELRFCPHTCPFAPFPSNAQAMKPAVLQKTRSFALTDIQVCARTSPGLFLGLFKSSQGTFSGRINTPTTTAVPVTNDECLCCTCATGLPQDFYSCSGSGSDDGDWDEAVSEASFYSCRTHATATSDKASCSSLLSSPRRLSATNLGPNAFRPAARNGLSAQTGGAVTSDGLKGKEAGALSEVGQAAAEYANSNEDSLGSPHDLDELVNEAEIGALSVDPLSGPKLDHDHPDLGAEEPANKRVRHAPHALHDAAAASDSCPGRCLLAPGASLSLAC